MPLRVAIGMRDLESNTVEVARRDTLTKEVVSIEGITEYLVDMLDKIQANIFKKAFDFRATNTYEVNSWEEFCVKIEEGGFLLAHWDGTSETEDKIKDETKATIRCLPFDVADEPGVCVFTGKPSERRVIFARAY